MDPKKFIVNRSVVDEEVVVTAYGDRGLPVTADSQEAVCKVGEGKVSRKKRWLIRTATAGLSAGRFFDPYNAAPADLVRQDGFTGNRRYEFASVTEAAFELYLRFLKTGNPAYYRQAAREQLP